LHRLNLMKESVVNGNAVIIEVGINFDEAMIKVNVAPSIVAMALDGRRNDRINANDGG
jgi:hypothetical protein